MVEDTTSAKVMSDRSVRDWVLRFARVSLGVAFLSAVADRFGFWGDFGTAGVDWGSMARFAQDVKALNPWAPDAANPVLSWFVTVLEAVLGIMLITGPYVRLAPLLSGALLSLFALSMALFLGVKCPLNYSVFTAAACAFLIATHAYERPQ